MTVQVEQFETVLAEQLQTVPDSEIVVECLQVTLAPGLVWVTRRVTVLADLGE